MRQQNSSTLEPCTLGYVYDDSVVGNSVVQDWDLVCDREGWKANVGAAPMVGYLLGGLVLGALSDTIGRKPTFLISTLLQLLSGIGTALAPEYFTFLIARTVVGFAISGIDATCFVLGMELVGPSKRTLAGIVCWFFETSGLLLAVTLAYFFNSNWRLLQMLYSLPCAVFLIYHWIAPESIRWLMSQGRKEEARALIVKTARLNSVDLPETMLEAMEATVEKELEEEASLSKTYTVLDLFRHPHMRVKSTILMLSWVVCASLYYVLLLDQTELSDNPFYGFFITCSVQMPGYVYVILTLERPLFGRKRSLCGFLIFSGLCLFCHPILPKGVAWLSIAFSVFGRFCANCSYTILHLFSAEQYPTVVRGIGMGFSYVVSRFGSILGPYILLLGHFSPIIFGVGAVLAGVLALMLPETLGKPLPESLMDGEKLKLTLPCVNEASVSDEGDDVERRSFQNNNTPLGSPLKNS